MDALWIKFSRVQEVYFEVIYNKDCSKGRLDCVCVFLGASGGGEGGMFLCRVRVPISVVPHPPDGFCFTVRTAGG